MSEEVRAVEDRRCRWIGTAVAGDPRAADRLPTLEDHQVTGSDSKAWKCQVSR